MSNQYQASESTDRIENRSYIGISHLLYFFMSSEVMVSIVTWNWWKYEQIVSGLDDSFVVQQVDIDIPEIQTNVLTEISFDKCRYAFDYVKWPVIVDDTWLYFHAYHEFPWALTKFLYKWIGLEWIQRLFVWEENVSAHFETVLWYMDETMIEPKLFVWKSKWMLSFDRLDEADWDVRLPYDMIFIPQWYDSPAFFNLAKWKKWNARMDAVNKLNTWLLNR